MTKANRFTLIATILLGILLYTVLRFAHDLNLAWDGSTLSPPPPAIDDTQGPVDPRIENTKDLRALLIEHDVDAVTALNAYARWSDARGFTGGNRLFGAAPTDDLATVADAELLTRSDTGDSAASQELAARVLFVDPIRAIDLFQLAAEQGSTFALLRIGSLLEALDTVSTGSQSIDPHIVELTEQGVRNSLRLTALSYAVTAVRDAGPPIVDYTVLAWLDRLNETTTPEEQVAVCEWSERTLLNVARGRARWGKPAITTVAPPVFFTIPDLAKRLPCGRTSYPVESLMDFSDCTVTRVRNAAEKELDTYICPAN